MARRYASRAAETLRSYLESDLPTHINTIETEESITLTDPVSYLKGVHPHHEQYPRIEVEFLEMAAEDFRNRYWGFRFAIHLVMRFPDVDVLTGQERLRQYLSAMALAIEADTALGQGAQTQNVIWTEIEEGSTSGETSDKGQFVGIATLAVLVHTEETDLP